LFESVVKRIPVTIVICVYVLLYRVKSDMDEPEGKLMGAHGYCTQVCIFDGLSSQPFCM